MQAMKIAMSVMIAGALLALYGVVTGGVDADVAATQPTDLDTRAATEGVGAVQSINGLAEIDEVISLFTQRSDAWPLDYLSRTQLGVALNTKAREDADLEGYEAAEAVLTEALALNPQWRPAKLALAGSLHAQHRFGEANELAASVAEQDPSSLAARALIGDTSLELGDYATARQAYGELAGAERSAPVVSRLARLASVEGDRVAAVGLANEALELSDRLALRPSDRAFYWFQLARMQFEVGDVDAAIAGYEMARSIDVGNAAATESLAFASAATGDHGRAVELYRELIEGGGAPDLHGSLADSLRVLGRGVEAAEQDRLGAELAAETLERFPAERRHLVGFFLERDTATAVRLAAADFEERRDVGAYDTLAWALFHDGQFDAAAEVLAEAGPEDPPHAAMMYHRAAIAAALGDEGEALRLVTQALAINPTFHPTEALDARLLLAALSENSPS